MRAAAGIANDEERAPALHEVRKQAKRVRYAAESLVPTYGQPAQRLARSATRIQTELGEIQDSAMCRAFLRRLSSDEGTTAGQAFLLGELHERERRLSLVAEERYASHGERLPKHGPATSWLS
jgi:CHAD domain-containing protein